MVNPISSKLSGRLLAVVLASFALLGQAGAQQAATYPVVKRGRLIVSTSRAKPDNSELLVVKDTEGNPLYELAIRATSRDSRTTDAVYLYLFASGEESPADPVTGDYNLLSVGSEARSIFVAALMCGAAKTDKDDILMQPRREFEVRGMRVVAVLDKLRCTRKAYAPGEVYTGMARSRVTVTVEPSGVVRTAQR